MFSFGVILCFLGTAFLSTVVGQVNWCQVQSQYCNGQQHIACSTNTFPTSTTCLNVKVLPMNSTLKNLILNRHNEYRQQIASGSNSKFPKAQKMTVMQWDDTLQFLAETHVAHCTFQHDQCRATPNYPYSGQNLYYTATSAQYSSASNAISNGLSSWFDEWKVAPAAIVNQLQWSMSAAFHFSVMVNDRNNRVGCGLLQYQYYSGRTLMNAFMLTCNYQYTNMIGQPMYTTGTPCSQCTCSTTYKQLCK